MKQEDFTNKQQDYAIFLPAISTFYATFIGKQRYENYVDPARYPSFMTSMENLNFFNKQEGLFTYKWALYSAGHANIECGKFVPSEDMIRNRDHNNSWVLGDSGGFQIAKGVWAADWKSATCPEATKKRQQVLEWMDSYMEYGMTLDIPDAVLNFEKGRKNSGITSFNDALNGTIINNDYFINNRNGNCKFLNVLQGLSHQNADIWYQNVKKYCDPKQYPTSYFNGWAMGGQNKCDIHLVLKRLVIMKHEGLLEEGVHDYVHFLGTSKLEWACLLTDLQRSLRKYYNPKITVTFDCASPFLASANALLYNISLFPHNGKWTYKMERTADNKAYATDNRLFGDVVLTDKIHNQFMESIITENLLIRDVCYYKPGDLNKINKEGRTSWDTFSYVLTMAHNIYAHIYAVQEANRKYDLQCIPSMLVYHNYKEHIYVRDLIDEIFSLSDKDKSLNLIDKYSRLWTKIVGTGIYTGKKTINATTKFSEFFE